MLTTLRKELHYQYRCLRLTRNLLLKRMLHCNLQVTYRCNFQCQICDFWKPQYQKTHELSLDDIRVIGAKLNRLGTMIISLAGGEPLIREDLPEVITILNKANHFPILITNGWFVDEAKAKDLLRAGLQEISVSVDYADPARHDAQRGRQGAWLRAVKALELLHKNRPDKRNRVHMISVLMDDNLQDVEPLIHPQIIGFIDELASRPGIIRTSVSTNGLALLRNPDLIPALARRNTVVSLQFDGFDDGVYTKLRGRPLLDDKLRILDLLAKSGVATSLTMTLAGGVNQQELKGIVEYFFSQRHVVSLMIQPVAFVGRAEGMEGRGDRLTIPDVLGLLNDTHKISSDDFSPLPCSHPLCFSLAYYLMLDGGGVVPVNRLVQADGLMDSLSNRTIFGLDVDEHQRLKDMVYELWSGPAGTAPDGQAVMDTLRNILSEMSCACFDARKVFTTAQRRIKSIFIHTFQDADTFDLARVRRCCNAYPQTDGRLLPACVHNVIGRHA